MTSPVQLPTTLIRPPPSVPGVPHPKPLGSLVAAAQRLTTASSRTHRGASGDQTWQQDGWDMFELVGEQRYLAVTLAGRMAQARFYVGALDEQTDAPVEVNNPDMARILSAIGDSKAAFAQMMVRMGINLTVAGEGYLVGIPSALMPAVQDQPDAINVPPVDPGLIIMDEWWNPAPTVIDVADLHWRMLSVSEVTPNKAGDVILHLGLSASERVTCKPEDVFLIRVWRQHPRRAWEADSPVRSCLPVLREIVGLTMKSSANIDSRLAGAGILIVPQSAARALKAAAGLPEDSAEDPLAEALIEAMMAPITDRGVAAAVVPLLLTVPDESAALFKHLVFTQPSDDHDMARMEAAIRRLALGQDAPPELLLGTSGMNHWGAWLVKEDVVSTHLEPPLALICDALTSQYLWPVLTEQGMTDEEAHRYVIWYDVSDLVVHPNHQTDAITLHAAGVIDDEALRTATGFDESTAPNVTGVLPEVAMALEMVKVTPALIATPGLPQLVAQIRAVMSGDIPTLTVAPPMPPPGQPGPVPPDQPVAPPAGQQVPKGGLPATAGKPAVVPAVAASAIVKSFEDAGPDGATFIQGIIAKAEQSVP